MQGELYFLECRFPQKMNVFLPKVEKVKHFEFFPHLTHLSSKAKCDPIYICRIFDDL